MNSRSVGHITVSRLYVTLGHDFISAFAQVQYTLGVMHPSAVAVLRLLQGNDLRGVTHSGAVWRIDSTSAGAEKLKELVLRTACAASSPFVHYDDPPPTHGRLASCESVAPGV